MKKYIIMNQIQWLIIIKKFIKKIKIIKYSKLIIIKAIEYFNLIKQKK